MNMLACALTGRPGAWVGLMAGNSSLNGCSALNLNEVQELSFSCYLLIEDLPNSLRRLRRIRHWWWCVFS